MNENLNLVEIMKDCPKGTKLYSTLFGDVELVSVYKNEKNLFPIEVKRSDGTIATFMNNGRLYFGYDGECALFPSKDQRDWSKFTAPWYKKERFDPKTLHPFDKVLVRDINSEKWKIQLFSHIIKDCFPYEYHCIGSCYNFCIPNNDDTKHLVGKNDDAPEFYRYWED